MAFIHQHAYPHARFLQRRFRHVSGSSLQDSLQSAVVPSVFISVSTGATARASRFSSGAPTISGPPSTIVSTLSTVACDVLVVWRLERLGRNLRHLVTLLDELHAVGVSFVSLGEGIDCTTPAGRLQLHVLAALAEFERGRIAERVAAVLARDGVPQAPPRTTAIGALGYYVSHADPANYQPSNIAFGLIPVMEGAPRRRAERRRAVAERALTQIETWRAALAVPFDMTVTQRAALGSNAGLRPA